MNDKIKEIESSKKAGLAIQKRLKELGHQIPLTHAYEAAAAANGYRNWQTLRGSFVGSGKQNSTIEQDFNLYIRSKEMTQILFTFSDCMNHFVIEPNGRDNLQRNHLMLRMAESMMSNGVPTLFISDKDNNDINHEFKRIARRYNKHKDVTQFNISFNDHVSYSAKSFFGEKINLHNVTRCILKFLQLHSPEFDVDKYQDALLVIFHLTSIRRDTKIEPHSISSSEIISLLNDAHMLCADLKQKFSEIGGYFTTWKQEKGLQSLEEKDFKTIYEFISNGIFRSRPDVRHATVNFEYGETNYSHLDFLNSCLINTLDENSPFLLFLLNDLFSNFEAMTSAKKKPNLFIIVNKHTFYSNKTLKALLDKASKSGVCFLLVDSKPSNGYQEQIKTSKFNLISQHLFRSDSFDVLNDGVIETISLDS